MGWRQGAAVELPQPSGDTDAANAEDGCVLAEDGLRADWTWRADTASGSAGDYECDLCGDGEADSDAAAAEERVSVGLRGT